MTLSLPAGSCNFVDFYKINRKEIDLILWHECWKHKQLFEPQDLFNDLFIRLERSDVLVDFDSTKAQLHTYLTHKIYGYAQHMVRKEITRLNRVGRVVLCQGLNFLGEDERAPELIAPSTDIDQDISIKELIDGIKKRCAISERYEKFISMSLEDASKWEALALSLNISRSYIRVLFQKIKRILREWRFENKETFSELSFDESVAEYAIDVKPEVIKNNPEHKKGFIFNPSTLTKKEEETGVKNKKHPIAKVQPKEAENKNHHPIAKVRPLNEAEISKIRDRFIELDGVIPNDTWVELKKNMSKDISIFQITGQVVRLHREVAKGTITIKNKKAYTAAIQAKRNKWKTYNSEKYRLFAERTGARVKKVTNSIAKRVKALKNTKAATAPKPEATQKIMILKKDSTFETREVVATNITKTDIPKLLKWKSVPKNVLDYMVVVA